MKLVKVIFFLAAIIGVLTGYFIFNYAGFYRNIGLFNLQAPGTFQYSVTNPSRSGEAKILTLGDSLVAGVGSDSLKATFIYGLAENLAKDTGKVIITNLGEPGATTTDLIEDQLPKVSQLKPDRIILLIGINDIHEKYSANKFKNNYNLILNELQKSNAKVTVLTIPYLGSSKIVRPPFNFILNERTKQFNAIIRELSKLYHFKMIDLYTETYTISFEDPKYYSLDLFHPSSQGYQTWSKIISDAN